MLIEPISNVGIFTCLQAATRYVSTLVKIVPGYTATGTPTPTGTAAAAAAQRHLIVGVEVVEVPITLVVGRLKTS